MNITNHDHYTSTSTSIGVNDIKSGVLDSSQVPSLQKKLESLLPYSIPLWERINFHLSRQLVPETSKIFVAVYTSQDDEEEGKDTASGATGPSGSIGDEWLRRDTTTSSASASSNPWLAAHVDLTNYGQTQVWVFASWECPSHTQTTTDPPTHTKTDDGQNNPIHKALMDSLFNYIHETLIPTMPMTPPKEWTTLLETGKTLTTPYSRNKIIFGTVGDELWRYFPHHARARTDPGYIKYIFTPESLENPVMDETGATPRPPPPEETEKTSSSPLPENYKFTTLVSTHLQTVLDRSTIPRTLSTLSEFVNVGVLYTDTEDDDKGDNSDSSGPTPIAWGFLGKDSSISSLHTEPEHRGKGLALCVARELLIRRRRQRHNHRHHQRQPDCTTQQPKGLPSPYYWAHADVSKSNMPSRRVMEKLGGKPMWMVMWTELDLAQICRPSTS
ncbi:hypothetical protein H2204_011225 [Knufia peltigerae]|uniref:N-acetyltransferase domain-containing protein n=1 Tax=Knufia peltigerae TaxID=1002370 RepID=A0AA39CTF2_9EURO|nr:hypothetical protein H2204_011225 [Knufia peltigerae]